MLYFTLMKTKEILMVCAAALLAGCAGLFGIGGQDATVGLKVNHMTAPANVSAKPVFSWKMASGRAGARQTAYQIEVIFVCCFLNKVNFYLTQSEEDHGFHPWMN